MIYLLLEDDANTIDSFLDPFYKHYHKTCVRTLNRYTKIEDIAQYSRPPLISDGWLLICYKVNKALYDKLALQNNNTIIIKTDKRKEAVDLNYYLDEQAIPHKFIDNSVIKKEKVIEFIIKELSVTEKDAEYLYKRHNGYLKEIKISVAALKNLPNVTQSDIKNFTIKRENISYFNVTEFLLGIAKPTVTYTKIVKMLYQYQYGIKHLIDYLIASTNDYLTVYAMIDSGKLTMKNYLSVRNNIKELKNFSEYQLLKIIESYNQVSVDRLLFVNTTLKTIKKRKQGILGIISLLRAVR